MGQTNFYLNGSDMGYRVNSRDDILAVLKKGADNIDAIDIEYIDHEFRVFARMKGEISWIGVGKTDQFI